MVDAKALPRHGCFDRLRRDLGPIVTEAFEERVRYSRPLRLPFILVLRQVPHHGRLSTETKLERHMPVEWVHCEIHQPAGERTRNSACGARPGCIPAWTLGIDVNLGAVTGVAH